MIRLSPVVTARSTVKPRPRNRTVSANPCIVPTSMPLATTSQQCAHPCWLADAAKKVLHPIWNGERESSTNDVKSNGSVTTTQPIAKLTKYPGHQHNLRYKLNNRPRCQQPTCRRCVTTKRCHLIVAHLPKVTIDHRRNINIFTVCWKKRTSDKNQTPNFYKQCVTCEKLYFALDSALTSRANPTMPTTRHLGTHNMCIATNSQLDCLLPTTRFIQLLLNCNVQTPSHQIFVWRHNHCCLVSSRLIQLPSCIATAHAMHIVTNLMAHPRMCSGEI